MLIQCAIGQKLITVAEAERAKDEAKYAALEDIAEQPTKRNTRRETGYDAYKARLQAGETVEWSSGGSSLAPRIMPGECCRYEPVTQDDDVEKGDIVFCQIKHRYWQHLVQQKTVRETATLTRFQTQMAT